MAQRRTPIQVPERRDDDAPATAEQLQFIRQLVTGMSLQGFRFDYRKMGTAQAASVIDQLLKLRDATGLPATNKQGSGCVLAAVRGAVTLVVVLIVLAGVGLGGYLIYNKINEKPAGGPGDLASASGDPAADEDADAAGNGNRRESKIFEGQYVEDDTTPVPDNRLTPREDSQPTNQTPGPAAVPTPVPLPQADAVVVKQLDQLRLLLAQLSQFTRKDYDISIRSQSSSGMVKKLEDLSTVMNALDPQLAQRVRDLVRAYGEPQLDGQAMRETIDALLADLSKWAQK